MSARGGVTAFHTGGAPTSRANASSVNGLPTPLPYLQTPDAQTRTTRTQEVEIPLKPDEAKLPTSGPSTATAIRLVFNGVEITLRTTGEQRPPVSAAATAEPVASAAFAVGLQSASVVATCGILVDEMPQGLPPEKNQPAKMAEKTAHTPKRPVQERRSGRWGAKALCEMVAMFAALGAASGMFSGAAMAVAPNADTRSEEEVTFDVNPASRGRKVVSGTN